VAGTYRTTGKRDQLKNHIERRNIKAGSLLTRGSASGDGKTLVGRVAYNSRSEDLGGFTEVIAPGAFTESLKTNEVFAYWSHDSSQVLARQSNGTLRLQDTATALKFQADLDPATTWGANAIAALKRSDVNSNSFGFSVDGPDGDEWRAQGDGTILRTIHKASLYEVSPVSVPAYGANSASLRNAPAFVREALQSRDGGIATGVDSDADADSDNWDSLTENCRCSDSECLNSCPACSEARESSHTICLRSAVNLWTWWTSRVPGSPVPKDADRNLLYDIIQRKLALL
jgi:uncharacterized protein